MSKAEKYRPLICVDLDGVLNIYDGWKAPEYFHPLRPGAKEFVHRLYDAGYRIVIFTTRYNQWVRKWLEENDISQYVEAVTDRKPPANVFLDDRAVCFRGNFDVAFEQIIHFKTFWEERKGDVIPGSADEE